MSVPDEHGYAITLPAGTTFTDGYEILKLAGDEPAVIEDVTIAGDDGLELVGALLAPPPRLNAAVQLMRSWPPRDEALDEDSFVEAVGARIEPLSRAPMGYELLLGLRVADEGYLVRESVTVTYRVGETVYEVDFPASIAVCTDAGLEIRGRCPFPQDAPSGYGDS
ncbi:hypothetical protein ACFP3Q_07230 [Nocardioides sp. GCM10027113]|uniref:hypothetical protein n=1 Tax=unclassified Nocardioides TaxID=2615069 RepID=UPI00360F825A